jgi:hypothetical protein
LPEATPGPPTRQELSRGFKCNFVSDGLIELSFSQSLMRLKSWEKLFTKSQSGSQQKKGKQFDAFQLAIIDVDLL